MNENDKYKLSNEEIFSKLVLIEKHLSGFCGQIYTPSDNFNPQDIISVQKEASKMMAFVGLNGYIAVVSYSKTGEGEGGNIELDDSREVFIEIKEDYKTNKDQTLAVMAHEICHKVLYVNHLYYPIIRIENEILTDLATVYVGFGVLSLNGCYHEYTTTEKSIYDDSESKTTHKHYIGYLSLRQFAVAFDIIRNVYKIPSADYKQLLNNNARSMLHIVASSCYTNISYDEFRDRLKELQQVEAKAKKNIILLEAMIDGIKSEISKNHSSYYNCFVDLLKKSGDSTGDSKRITKQIIANEVFHTNKQDNNLLDNNRIINDLLCYYSYRQPLNTSKLNDIECPHCGFIKENAIKDKKEVFIKCPKCGYLFIWDATPLKKENGKSSNHQKKKSKTWEKMVRYFKTVFWNKKKRK